MNPYFDRFPVRSGLWACQYIIPIRPNSRAQLGPRRPINVRLHEGCQRYPSGMETKERRTIEDMGSFMGHAIHTYHMISFCNYLTISLRNPVQRIPTPV